MGIETENSVTLVRGKTRFKISPLPPASLIALPRLDVRPGRLRENVVTVPGADGTTRAVLGYDDAEVELTLQIWDEEQLPNLKQLSELFRPRREEKTHEPLKIFAPAAQRWGILYVYIVDIHERPWDPRSGLIVELTLREWQPQEKKKTQQPLPVSPKGASSGRTRGGGRDVRSGGGNNIKSGGDFSFLDGEDFAAPPSRKGPPKP